MKFWVNFAIIVLFSILISNFFTNSFQNIIQLVYKIPDEGMFFGFWGKTSFLRILLSLLSSAIGGFVIGSYLSKRRIIAIVVYSIPTLLFWGFVLYMIYSEGVYDKLGFFSRYNLIPLTIFIFTIPVSLFGCWIGKSIIDEFDRPYSILNIKWYNWLWIFPFLLNQLISVIFLLITLLWMTPTEDDLITNLIFNFGNTVARIITFAILFGLFIGLGYLYEILTEDNRKIKLRWLQIFGFVLIFNALYFVLVGLPMVNL